ncbi:MAG TPA: hypothetical protein VHX36_04740 [Candidatus Acidoferrales bacterium]|jgi:hypothetical protein|nr:hypothetical protein [Candidatus Acidoferrales bacterium]
MVFALIYIVFLLALIEFFVYRCRSILATSRKIDLPAGVREAAGVDRTEVAPGDFEKLVELASLCPEESTGDTNICAVCTYYNLVDILGRASRGFAPRLKSWAEKEQRNCSHFAAVALDRRISGTRRLLAQGVQSPF